MERRYWLEDGEGGRSGPFTAAELRSRLAAGELTPETRVRDEATGAEATLGVAITADASTTLAPPTPERAPRGVAWVVLGVLLFVLVGCAGVAAAILLPVLAQARLSAKRTATVSNLKQIALGTLLYASDHDDLLPPDTSSGEALEPFLRAYAPSIEFRSLNPAGGALLGNPTVAGVRVGSVALAGRTALLLDSAPWERKTRCVAFLDGSARVVEDRAAVEAIAAGFVFRDPIPSVSD